MAAKKQPSKKTSSSANAKGRRTTKKEAPSAGFQKDVILLIVLSASVIFLISALGFGGIVGNIISQFLFGVMGYMAYAFPFLLFIGCALLMSRQHTTSLRKGIASFLLFVFLCGLLQYLTEGYQAGTQLMDYYDLCSLYKTGGGIIGGAILFSSVTAFGVVGGVIIILLALVVALILLTQKSFFGFLNKIVDFFSGSMERRRERYEAQEPERQLLREQKELHRQKMREQKQQQRLLEMEEKARSREEAFQEEHRRREEALAKRREAQKKRAEELKKMPAAEPAKKPAQKKRSSTTPAVQEVTSDQTTSQDNSESTGSSRYDQGFLAGTWLDRRENTREPNSYVADPITLTQEPRELHPYVEVPAEEERSLPRQETEISQEMEFTIQGQQADLSVFVPEETDETTIRMDSRTSDDALLTEEGPQESALPHEEEDLPAEEQRPSEGTSAAQPCLPQGESLRQTGPSAREKAPKNPHSSPQEITEGIKTVASQIQNQEEEKPRIYHFPPLRLLKKGGGTSGDSQDHLRATAKKLQDTLYNFGVNAKVVNVSCGPTVTRYELQPEMGVKVSRIVGLQDDIKLNLATSDIRIEAPIPGKAAVGIEVPNKENSPVFLRDLLESREFQDASSNLAFAAGKDIAGKPVVTDIAKMPHLLIAGATGSGKSVCINTLIISLLYKASPEDVKLIMIDPKVVELSVYNGIPHLFIPVVTDPKKAAGALNWAVSEMTSRYDTFAEYGVRNLAEYNKKIQSPPFADAEQPPKKLPQIVIIVDELADLMMVAPGDVEDAICRLAQLARAAGIHLVIATQRPSVNVITGLIKANMPSRIAFAVSSGVDSRTILDMNGAEKLLGKGDMLFYPQGLPKPARLQGAFVSDEEVSAIVHYLTDKNPKSEYDEQMEQKMTATAMGGASSSQEERDIYFVEAGRFIIDKDKASIGMLQRMFKVGFNRAARIMDQLCEAGVVGPEEGTKPRTVLMSPDQFENFLEENG